MRYVELVPGVRSSVVGFGCAPILGSVDAGKARRAIHAARDVGITHFDLARSYGYGEAERFVGRELRNQRGEVVIATKFGIEATPAARLLRLAKPVIRPLLALRKRRAPSTAPSAKATVSIQPGRIFVRRVPLKSACMRRSLERSLAELRTDYVDYFFIHEPVGRVTVMEELCDEAERLKAAGKLRGWGLSFMRASWAVHAQDFARFDCLQFDNSPGTSAPPDYERIRKERRNEANIFFSPFRGANSAGIGSGTDRAGLLRTLTDDFPRSVILCSMFGEAHIRANAAAV